MGIKNKQNSFWVSMLKLAVPIALQNLFLSSAQIIDTVMVTNLGIIETAAMGICSRWGFLANLFFFGLSSGSAALASQFWGAKETKSVHRVYGLGLIFSLTFGILYSVCAFFFPEKMMMLFTNEAAVIEAGATYLRSVCLYGIFQSINSIVSTILRATEDVTTPLYCSAVSIGTNTILNYILIFGKFGAPALGLKGAAIATAVAAAVQMILLLTIGMLRKKVIRAPIRELFGFDRAFLKKFLAITGPVLFNEVLWAVGTNIYSMVFARTGSLNYAAFTIFGNLEQLTFVFFVGICHACAIMVGKAVGSGRLSEAYTIARKFVVLTPILGVVTGIMLALLRTPLLSLMPAEVNEAKKIASVLLLIYSFWIGVRNIPYTCVVGTFRAGGDSKTGVFYDLISLYLIGVPAVLFFGLYVKVSFPLLVIIMYVGEDVLKTFFCIHHFRSRRWIKPLTMAGATAKDETA